MQSREQYLKNRRWNCSTSDVGVRDDCAIAHFSGGQRQSGIRVDRCCPKVRRRRVGLCVWCCLCLVYRFVCLRCLF